MWQYIRYLFCDHSLYAIVHASDEQNIVIMTCTKCSAEWVDDCAAVWRIL